MTLIKVQDSHVAIVKCCKCGDDVQRTEPRSVLTCGHRHIGCRPAKDSGIKVALNKLFNWVVK